MLVREDVLVKFDPVVALVVVLRGNSAGVVDAVYDGDGHGR